MFKLVAKVAVDGEMLNVMEAPVFEVRGRQMLAQAHSDERALPTTRGSNEDGEVWVSMHAADGELASALRVGFHRADAADALQLYFGAAPCTVAQCLSRSNIAAHYKEHRAALKGSR
ncbi:hypothetical protein [Ralstonia pseudosolanacearum]|uniref:hypothetical protein n=1 Tax=Ralstonia pseudosolanacearum TaxID=1310165 RepID=UPI003CF7E9BD